jgi:hypothetical protein
MGRDDAQHRRQSGAGLPAATGGAKYGGRCFAILAGVAKPGGIRLHGFARICKGFLGMFSDGHFARCRVSICHHLSGFLEPLILKKSGFFRHLTTHRTRRRMLGFASAPHQFPSLKYRTRQTPANVGFCLVFRLPRNLAFFEGITTLRNQIRPESLEKKVTKDNKYHHFQPGQMLAFVSHFRDSWGVFFDSAKPIISKHSCSCSLCRLAGLVRRRGAVRHDDKRAMARRSWRCLARAWRP